jgi:hypothetical protein
MKILLEAYYFLVRLIVGVLQLYLPLVVLLMLLVTANIVPSSLILATLIMEALRSSETSVVTRATGRNIPEGGFLHSHRRENFKFYIALTGWTL